MRRTASFLLLILAIGCGGREPAVDQTAYRAEIEQWQRERQANLRKDTSWLTLAGLFWLAPGENRVGTAEGDTVRLPEGKAPAVVGTIALAPDGTLSFAPAPDAGVTVDGKPATAMTLLDDHAEKGPTMLKLGSLTFHPIRRADRIGVRVKDSQSPALAAFKGLDYYPVDPKWRVAAKLERAPKEIPILNIIGIVENQPSPGPLKFTVDGQEYALDPIQEGDQLFVIFADQTSGTETYGAGRYLYAAMPGADGNVVLDFNRAYKPALRLHRIRDVPPPAASEPACAPHHGGGEEVCGGTLADLSSNK